MENPPHAEERAPEPRHAARASRAFWATTIIIALAFAAIGVRRARVPIYSIERTQDPLVFLAWPDSCDQDARIGVVESPSTITVTARRNRAFCGGTGACAESAPFRLEAPLGDREIIDGDRGVPLEVRDSQF